LGLAAASAAAQYVVTHPRPSHNPVNLDFLLDPLSKSEFLSLTGSLLLFITNYLSILLAGGGVLALLGLGGAAAVRVTGTARRNAYILIGVAVLLVAIPLVATGARLAGQTVGQIQTRRMVETWVSDSNYELQNLEIDFNTEQIGILISGSGEPPLLSELGPQLEEMFQDDTIEIWLDIVPAEEKFYPESVAEDASSD
jgi:hypothetical protein